MSGDNTPVLTREPSIRLDQKTIGKKILLGYNLLLRRDSKDEIIFSDTPI